ncbi:MAG: hypothetical protein DRP64_19715, partial [Verrucomicrobia bacterium]
PVHDDWVGESAPSGLKIWSEAYRSNMRRPLTLIRKVRQLVPAFIRANRVSAEHEEHPHDPMVRTRFNGRVSATRVTDAMIMDLDAVKGIRKAVDGSTVNDVIVAIVGGGLRRYLQDKKELPEYSLSCGAPISMRQDSNSDSRGNQVSQMTISLATDVEEPLERLAAVHASASESKEFSEALGTSVLMDVSEVMIPQLLGWGMRAASIAGAAAEAPVPNHVIVSNVPGPQFPLYLAGAQVHLIMGMGPLLHMMGMFHAALSASGKITINFVSTREMMPDPAFYRQCLQEAFDELRIAAKKSTGKGKQGGKKFAS